jgi:NAD(P)H dehydrogenase (quinone)
MLSLTTGGPQAAYRDDGFNGDIDAILRPIHRGILQFVGFDVLAPQIVYAPVRMTDEQRRGELDRFGQRLSRIAGERPVEVGRY